MLFTENELALCSAVHLVLSSFPIPFIATENSQTYIISVFTQANLLLLMLYGGNYIPRLILEVI
jgi:uncharacterized membrane protein